MTSPTPVDFGPAVSVPLTWTDVDNRDGTFSHQGVAASGLYSYTVVSSADGLHHRADQLLTDFPSVDAAKAACQSDSDVSRRADAWQKFFEAHEPPVQS
jgi:hypothetical protein